MATRVVASDQAKTAAQEMGTLVQGDLGNSLMRLKQLGQVLGNPNHWDSQLALEFRSRQWPQATRAIDMQLQELSKLRTSTQKIVQDILSAGNEGGGEGARAATAAAAAVAAAGAARDDSVLKKVGDAWSGGTGTKSLFTNSKAYSSWINSALKAESEWKNLTGPQLEADLKSFMGSLGRWHEMTQAADKAFHDLSSWGATALKDTFNFSKILNGLKNTEGIFAKVKLGWGAASDILGKIALPLTVVSGIKDAITGGGYSGWRGWATRGMGVAGAVGAGALIGVEVGLVSLGPVGIGIAGAAVLAYGAWQLGNLIWDNRAAIGHAVGAAWNATTHAVGTAARAVGSAVSGAAHAVGNFVSHIHIF